MQLSEELRRKLVTWGFDEETFLSLQRDFAAGSAGKAVGSSNRLPVVAPPGPLPSLPEGGTPHHRRLSERGRDALRKGTVGLVVLSGGMATRFGGAIKALVPAVDAHTFLDLKVADVRRLAEREQTRIPIYLMTSFATDEPVRSAAEALSSPCAPVSTFLQFASLRLDEAGGLFRTATSDVSPYAPGHGDLTFALRRSGLLRQFREQGGQTLFMSNVDNLGATLDLAVLGAHLESGAAITAEIVAKHPGDAGGAPALVDGRLQILESFRFPSDFDQSRIAVFNTNTFWFDAQALDRDFPLTWFTVRKQVEGRTAIQFERLVGELTAFLPSHFLTVPRDGVTSRFLPVKDPDELEARRGDIRAVLEARSIIEVG